MAEADNSGKEVPIATTVKPINNSDMPNKRAMITPLSTNNLPPKTKPTNPIKTKDREENQEKTLTSSFSPSTFDRPKV